MDLMPADHPVVFTTSWCGYCIRLKAQLGRAGIEFREIDIEDHADGAATALGSQRPPEFWPTVSSPFHSTTQVLARC
jgi:mycoredoxin